MDIADFFDTFFEEAEELLADMEQHLLELDVDDPDSEQLNAIFRAAHSIKGGAGTFGFSVLQKTTHIFENLLDHARKGELTLRAEHVDTFLEAKDIMHEQLDAYRNEEEPNQEAYERICQTLQQIALEEIGKTLDAPAAAPAPAPKKEAPQEEKETAAGSEQLLKVALLNVGDKDRGLLVEELEQLGDIQSQSGDEKRYEVTLSGGVSADDIEAVMCFIIEPDQIEITALGAAAPAAAPDAKAKDVTPAAEAPAVEAKPAAPALKEPAKATASKSAKAAPKKAAAESSSIRVSVDKVDQIINLVGELIITQSMLDQTVSDLGDQSVGNSSLQNGMSLLQRNARDLQEAVMSIRMIPMEFVFSRFPRVVRDTAGKLGKEIELVTEGKSTELDKSLVERITDPLTHLVRNSLDHGIEMPDEREALGKPRTGKLVLSARHQGGNILIEVRDDGAGMDRDRLLAKARENGLNVSDTMSDEDVYQLIFAPGFSTAKEVTDVSGRGVGMDVVKRNIQGMGGRVEIQSKKGEGTNTRIVLPLTLAILDGMSIKVGNETFILPLSTVLESLQPAKGDMYAMAGDDVVLKVRDEYLPVIAIHEVLDVENAITDPTKSIAVIVQGEGRRYAMLVDELIGQQQVVVKNLEDNYRKVPGVSAATILGDGSVALILDITGLHRLSRAKKEAGKVANQPHLSYYKEAEPS
ncbi:MULTISPECIES: chemotaxis protein CheA [Halomonadaceae]|jgi:two-component system chemotaxis sensor kinase CheA|uniref:Chemotaxis protein CheA n=1 Tax=Vreelandella piezotolerans TaxID=2609667 RepID=A0ABQ6X9A3_9GAMM|nr:MULTISPECIES: chemotaxis protein CheA [Halomonas]KAE8438596.1 chemotaxis protein CheA [Halomonas piezotolerans]MCG7576863.1 chemotaxis protein CheA [Halomonas sp. MMH1-48]MCG7591456.1 chemotaxis protein CheA [Halomonas sp. McD50-5]MCG7603926.1 chemotaxis protein CheA [Halomonas sp. MM17-34]MCG7613266.1 chemotaxis protein CheA [Halomonas sp. MM17-29]